VIPIAATGRSITMNEYESVKMTRLNPSPADIDAADHESLGKRITLRWLKMPRSRSPRTRTSASRLHRLPGTA
jgi:hypothetical protein